MMYNEFVKRTNVEISFDEYKYVEDAYYDSNLLKDEFCKEWLEAYKSGKWAVELKFRKKLDEQEAEMKEKIESVEKDLAWYVRNFDLVRKQRDKAEGELALVSAKLENAKMYVKNLNEMVNDL